MSLYPTPSIFDISSIGRIIGLYFAPLVDEHINIDGLEPLLDFSTGVQSERAFTTGVEKQFVRMLTYDCFLTKFNGYLVVKDATAEAITVRLRGIVKYPDGVRANKTIYDQSLVTSALPANQIHEVAFPQYFLTELMPAGTKLIVGITLTFAVGACFLETIALSSNPSNLQVELVPTNSNQTSSEYARIP